MKTSTKTEAKTEATKNIEIDFASIDAVALEDVIGGCGNCQGGQVASCCSTGTCTQNQA